MGCSAEAEVTMMRAKSCSAVGRGRFDALPCPVSISSALIQGAKPSSCGAYWAGWQDEVEGVRAYMCSSQKECRCDLSWLAASGQGRVRKKGVVAPDVGE